MGYNVLIVDDSSVMRKIIRRSIRQTGIRIDQELEAGDGKEALNALANHNVNLIFCDVNMPNMDGLSFVKAVRSKPELDHIKIVMITTVAGLDIVDEAITSGADAYVVKPFTPDQLNEKIQVAVES